MAKAIIMKLGKKTYGEMSKKEKDKFENDTFWVGLIIGHIVAIEDRINKIIGFFFNAHKKNNKHIESFMNHYMLVKMDFSLKVAYLDHMINILVSDNHHFDNLNKLLTKQLELRNLLAHQPFIINSKDLHFVKKEFITAKTGKSPGRRISPPITWTKAFRNIHITKEQREDIAHQATLTHEFLIILEDFFENNTRKKPQRSQEQIIGFLNDPEVAKYIVVKNKLGVFGIGLKEE